MKNKASRGFTLIELMIVVVILGIVSAIAYPSYTGYVLRSKRTECRSALMQVLQQQERYFTQQNAYLAYASTAASIPMRQFSADTLATSACTIDAAACAASTLAACVVLTATPVTTDAEVGNITLQSDGARGCSGTSTSKCWTN